MIEVFQELETINTTVPYTTDGIKRCNVLSKQIYDYLKSGNTVGLECKKYTIAVLYFNSWLIDRPFDERSAVQALTPCD